MPMLTAAVLLLQVFVVSAYYINTVKYEVLVY